MRPAALRELDSIDRAVYAAIAGSAPTPILDRWLGRLSRSADYSRLWIAVAAALALAGGHRGRLAAVSGLASIACASAVANLGIKLIGRRRRPDRVLADVPEARYVTMPGSSSFPSGHSASAFAFAVAAGDAMPALALPLRALAAAVAYSRVHTGVHYPGDVVAGALLGAAIGAGVAQIAARRAG